MERLARLPASFSKGAQLSSDLWLAQHPSPPHTLPQGHQGLKQGGGNVAEIYSSRKMDTRINH